ATSNSSWSRPSKELALHEVGKSPLPSYAKSGPASSVADANAANSLMVPDQVEANGSPDSTPEPELPERFRIRDESGHCVVARLHGRYEDETALMQPDGQIGFPSMLIPTGEPFVPMTAETLQARLREGPFADCEVLTTAHYLILYQSKKGITEGDA